MIMSEPTCTLATTCSESMNKEKHHGSGIIVISFIVAIMLTAMPLPEWAINWRPAWVAMVLIYWCMALPHQCRYRCRLAAWNFARCLTGHTTWAKCNRSYYTCIPDIEITSTCQNVSTGATGIGHMSFCPGLPIIFFMGTWHYGCATQIMDILDACFYQYGVVAMVVYYSPGFTPPLSRVLIRHGG
jgi:hypothetical protein